MIRNLNFTKILTLLIGIVFISNVSAYGNTFSCSYGKQAACLDYSDKVCSSFSKCISNDAICFDTYTCNYKGFVCKSKYEDLADEYGELFSKCKNISVEYDDLVDEYNGLLRKYKNAVSKYDNLQSCINYASSLDGAKNCY